MTGEKDFTGVNATLGWNAKVGFIPMWCVGAGASKILGGGAFETSPVKITMEKAIYHSPDGIECLNPTAAKVGELCAMKFKGSSWFSYLVGSTTWGTKVPVPVHFRDTDVFLGNGNKEIKENDIWTNKFIFPPYEFSIPDAIVSNFHLPQSTMLITVAAFGGFTKVMNAYRVALEEGYRFGPYGDAMLIV